MPVLYVDNVFIYLDFVFLLKMAGEESESLSPNSTADEIDKRVSFL